ncbi:hypothetical protein SP19_188 [Salmonella phage 19]|nr:putative regulatory protein [Salmonella phage 41]AKJ74679.1 hypothetical protein SP19_188 [Salmonella phage 19]
MAAKQQLTKRRRGKGRPLKEESNAIQLEKNLLDLKTKMIAMIPDAHLVLRDLMMSTDTKDNIRENIARFVIEKGEEMMSDYFDEENESEEETKTLMTVTRFRINLHQNLSLPTSYLSNKMVNQNILI